MAIHIPVITYSATGPSARLIEVRCDGKKVGFIRQTENGYVYSPIGASGFKGEFFKTLVECKRSLEAE